MAGACFLRVSSIFFAAGLLAAGSAAGSTLPGEQGRAVLAEFTEMLALPNLASDIPAIEANAAFLEQALQKRGFATRRLVARAGTPPAVFAELKVPGARRTIIYYAHFDGQAASQPGWKSPPWRPVLRDPTSSRPDQAIDWRTATMLSPDWRIYARSASDDKGSIQALLSAIDGLRGEGRRPTANVKIFLEGEEEAGSPNLSAILLKNRDLLKADLFILGDGPAHPSGAALIYLGARGLMTLELTAYGPNRPLHDGHFGNWVPNPAVLLSRLLAAMRDERGRVLIPGFYDQVAPLTAEEAAATAAMPAVETELRRSLAIGASENEERLIDSLLRPALNIRGIQVGRVGAEATNTIFTQGQASIDFRLVPNQSPAEVRNRTNDFMRSQGWHVVDTEPSEAVRSAHPKVIRAVWSEGYAGYRAQLPREERDALVTAVARATGVEPVVSPSTGGSVPMAIFSSQLKVPVIMLSFANFDNGQHAENENLRLGNLWQGIAIYKSLLTAF